MYQINSKAADEPMDMIDESLLYQIIEEQLAGPVVVENEAVEPFAKRVVQSYLEAIKQKGYSIPITFKKELEEDFLEEAVAITRKKTYGHLTVSDYQESMAKKKSAV